MNITKFNSSSFTNITKKLSKYNRKKYKYSNKPLIIIDYYDGDQHSITNREITSIFLDKTQMINTKLLALSFSTMMLKNIINFHQALCRESPDKVIPISNW